MTLKRIAVHCAIFAGVVAFAGGCGGPDPQAYADCEQKTAEAAAYFMNQNASMGIGWSEHDGYHTPQEEIDGTIKKVCGTKDNPTAEGRGENSQ